MWSTVHASLDGICQKFAHALSGGLTLVDDTAKAKDPQSVPTLEDNIILH
jgi:hypothetical protein